MVSKRLSLLGVVRFTQLIWYRYDGHFLFQGYGYGIVAGDRPIDQLLLYHFLVARLVCGDLCVGGEIDGWDAGGISYISGGSPEKGRMMNSVVWGRLSLPPCVHTVVRSQTLPSILNLTW